MNEEEHKHTKRKVGRPRKHLVKANYKYVLSEKQKIQKNIYMTEYAHHCEICDESITRANSSLHKERSKHKLNFMKIQQDKINNILLNTNLNDAEKLQSIQNILSNTSYTFKA